MYILKKKRLGYGNELKRWTCSRKLQNTKTFKSVRQYGIILSCIKYEGLCFLSKEALPKRRI